MSVESNFLAECLSESVKQHPLKPAFIYQSDQVIGYQDLLAATQQWGQIFKAHRLNSETVVLVCLPQENALAVVMTSLLVHGIPTLTVSPKTSAATWSHYLTQFYFSAVVITESLMAQLTRDWPVLRTRQVVVVGYTLRREPILLAIFDFNFKGERRDPTDFAWALATSGSTGLPKIATMSLENLRARAEGELKLFQISRHSHLLNLLSFSHDLGLNQLLCTLASGATLELFSSTMAVDLIKLLSQDRFTGVTGMPGIWESILYVPSSVYGPISFDGYLTISGGSLDLESLAALRKIFPAARIIKTYGQTETFRSLAEDRPEKLLSNSCGRSLEGVQVVVVDASLRPCGVGETGQLVHFGAGMMSGYWGDPVSTAAKLAHLPEISKTPGILTGDFFRVLENDEYEFVGRRDDLVKRNGYRFYLTEVEHFIKATGWVDQVCVAMTRRPNHWGHASDHLVAFVHPRDPMLQSQDLIAELQAVCKRGLESYKIPNEFRVMEDMPLTASRKLDRQRLLERE